MKSEMAVLTWNRMGLYYSPQPLRSTIHSLWKTGCLAMPMENGVPMAMQPGFEPPPTASSANTFRQELNSALPRQSHALYQFVSCYTGAAQKIFSGTSFHKNDRKWIVKMHGSQSLIIPCYIALQAFSLSIPLHLHARCSLHWPSTGGSEEGTSIVIQTNCAYPLKNQQRGLVA